MQAIKTKYLPATNTLGSRIKAECLAGSIVIPFDYSLDDEALHNKAVQVLLKALDWKPDFINSGVLKDGSYVHVLEFIILQATNNSPEFLKN